MKKPGPMRRVCADSIVRVPVCDRCRAFGAPYVCERKGFRVASVVCLCFTCAGVLEDCGQLRSVRRT